MPNDDESTDFNVRDHFFGTATVGERGQIVIPVEARKKHQITAGDKLLIMGTPDRKGIMLVKMDAMREFMTNMLQELQRMDQEPQEHTHDRMEEKSS
jgi:AbrB family looped-hinge helix DNA binding protein